MAARATTHQAPLEKTPICARPQPDPYSIRFIMQEDLIALLSTWISARHTEAWVFYIQYDLYSSSINVTGNQTTDLKERKPNISVPEVLLSLEGEIQMCIRLAKGRLNLSWTPLTQGQSIRMLPPAHPLRNLSPSGENNNGWGCSRWKWLNYKDDVVRRRTGLLSDQQRSLPVWALMLQAQQTHRMRQWRSPVRSRQCDRRAGTPNISIGNW